MIADSRNNDSEVKFGMGNTEKRSPFIWEKSGTVSQGRQHLNKVLQGLRGSESGAEEEQVKVGRKKRISGWWRM